MEAFSPYGHDLRMLTFAPPSTWEPVVAPTSAIEQPSTAYNFDGLSRTGPPSSHVLFNSQARYQSNSPLPHSAVSALQSPPRSTLSPLNLPASQLPPPPSDTCLLLQLPPELLDQILAYALPYTLQTPKGIAWERRSTALLATCRAFHDIGARYLYGRNTFVLQTSFTGTMWHLAWIRQDLRPAAPFTSNGNDEPFLGTRIPGETYLPPSSAPLAASEPSGEANLSEPNVAAPCPLPPGSQTNTQSKKQVSKRFRCIRSPPIPLVPSRKLPFPNAIAARYLPLIRFVAVEIQVEDPYTGQIKYGYGGPGLAEGVRNQVVRLVGVLSQAEELRRVIIRLAGLGTARSDEERRLLEPIAKLKNVGTLEIETGLLM